MKTILVPVEHHRKAAFSLRLASRLGRRFAAYLETFALQRPPLLAPAWDPASVAIMNSADWDHRKVVAEAKDLVERVMEEEGLPEAPAGGSAELGASWRWSAEELASDEFLGSLARAFDLTVIGQPRSDGTSIATLEAVLFESGGPVLIAPSHEVSELGQTIVIAWNGSSETARTIAFAQPFLAMAGRVVVLGDDGAIGHKPSGARIVQRLEHNGVHAELMLMPDGKIRSGEAILREASTLGCDLLVKGAYTQSRLRQMIFGGATKHILTEAKMPVFMAH